MHFLRFFVGAIWPILCVLSISFRYFKAWDFNQTFKFEDVFKFFVILFKNTINPKEDFATVLFDSW